MSKQFETLFPHLKDMSDEDLQGHIGEIRRRKYIERKASAKRTEKAAAPAKARAATKVTKLVSDMSDADKAKLLALLEEGNDE